MAEKGTFRRVTFVWSLLTSLIKVTEGSNSNIVLNNASHCSSKDILIYNVTSHNSFTVTVDKALDFECEADYIIKFSSVRKLCIVQDKIINRINDRNANLIINGCQETNGHVCDLQYHPDKFHWTEKCTSSNDLTFHLQKVNRNFDVDSKKLIIDLKVMSIDSPKRNLYMNETYCYSTYMLSNSQVSVFNLQFSESPLQTSTKLCELVLQKDSYSNTSICLVYIPLRKLNCACNWTFKVSKGSIQKKEMTLYQLNCSAENVAVEHSRCFPNDTDLITLIMQRENCVEPSEMFRFIMVDSNKSAKELLEHYPKQEFLEVHKDSELGDGWVTLIVIGTFTSLSSVAIIIYKRHWKRFQKENSSAVDGTKDLKTEKPIYSSETETSSDPLMQKGKIKNQNN